MARNYAVPPTLDDLEYRYKEASHIQFELTVKRILEKKLNVTHGGRYHDPATQKIREFDLLGHEHGVRIGSSSEFFNRLELAVECKNIHESNALIIGCRKAFCEDLNGFMVMSRSDEISHFNHTNISLSKDFDLKVLSNDGGDFIGTEILEVKPSGKEVYDKWSQALNHAMYRYPRLVSQTVQGSVFTGYVACIPIFVVPNDRLFRVVNEKSGAKAVESIDFQIIKAGVEIEVGLKKGVIQSFVACTENGISRFIDCLQV